ncbi:hypothetical protein FQZ97_1046460 [compost metagenome]
MVATPGMFQTDWITVATTIAVSGPGTRAMPRMRDEYSTSSRLSTPIASVGTCTCVITPSRCSSFSWKCSPPVAGRPRKSRHCPTKMITPMPLVKPTTTGAGMNRITAPILATPMSSRMKPAISVATRRPSMPYLAVTPARMAMKAPVGPAICTRLPPSSDTMKPPMMAV